MDDDNEIRFVPVAFELINELSDNNGFAPMVEVYFPDSSVAVITSPERYATARQAMTRALRIADEQRERITALYAAGGVAWQP